MTLSIAIAIKNCDTQHNVTQYCFVLSVANKPIMPSVFMLNVVMLSVVAP